MEHELEIRDESELKSLTYYEDDQGATEVDNEPGCVDPCIHGWGLQRALRPMP